uniref:Sushi domain-containing protein n=1 Tax=Amazona collaria TaxID=241587 RepID=A0A8B9F860_9PSIT
TTLDGKNGVWSGPPPSCGGRVERAHAGTQVGSFCAYCFIFSKTRTPPDNLVQCQLNSTWEPPVPVCEQGKSGCNAPTRLAFAELKELYRNQTVFPVGRTVEYVCRPGYTQHIEMSPAITCLENRTWSAALEFCKMLQCPSPPNIDNGNHNSPDLEVFTAGMVVNYSCDPGYSLLGEASIHCTDSGNWSLPLPQCAGTPQDGSYGYHIVRAALGLFKTVFSLVSECGQILKVPSHSALQNCKGGI